MCGYVAIFRNNKSEIPYSLGEDLIHHRGPDDKSILIKDNYVLGFWRLSIVDVDKGRQPMEDEASGLKILFNGEVYNYKEIRKELIRRKHKFSSESDTEVILKAFIEWGTDCFNMFEGMFSICLIDSKKEEIVLVRDSVGIKPLYYSFSGQDLIIASEQKAILKTVDLNAEVNLDALDDYLLYQSVLGEQTLFKNISKIQRGEILTFHLRTQEVISSSRIIPENKKLNFDSYEEYKSYIKKEITRQTIDALDTDLDLTFQLSGGIDSNLMMSIASHYFPEKKKYTVSSSVKNNFDDDELIYIKKSVDYFKAEHEIVEIGEENFFNYLEESIEYLDEPVGDPGVVAQFIVNEKISEFSKIGIAGQGADELYFGYMRNFLAYISSLDESDLFNSEFFVGWESYLDAFKTGNSISPEFAYFNKMTRFNTYEGCDKDIRTLQEKISKKNLKDFKDIFDQSPDLNSFMVNTEIDLQLQALLQMEDRASMRYSVETRVPLCTISLLSSAFLGPIDWKFRNDTPKGILRDAFSDILPSHILERKKKVGRPIPLKDWLQNTSQGKDYLNLLHRNKEFINSLFSANILDYALNHPNIYDRTTWALLSIILWSKKYNVSF